MTIGTPSVDLPALYKVLGIEAPQRPVDKLVITVTSDAVTIEASGKVEHSIHFPLMAEQPEPQYVASLGIHRQ